MNKTKFEEVKEVLRRVEIGEDAGIDILWCWETIEELMDEVISLRSQRDHLSDQLVVRTCDCNDDYRFGPGD